MTSLNAAPSVPQEEEEECPHCEATASYIRYEGDTVCRECGFTPHPSGRPSSTENPWGSWHEHRAAEYDGWFGPERIKMVGGFVSAYDL